MMTEILTLRRARPDDCEALFHWRNDEFVRRYSIDSSVIDWDTHQGWFARTLENPNRFLLIGEFEGKPVGVLRYDLQDQKAIVSIYLVPGCGGKGYGVRILDAGTAWLRGYLYGMGQHGPSFETGVIEAIIRPQNIASIKSFERAGYKLVSQGEHSLTYHYNLTDPP